MAKVAGAKGPRVDQRAVAAVDAVERALPSGLMAATAARDPLEGKVGAAVFVVALAVYFRTLHPTVAGGDAGELMVVAHEAGTPHPPGYPTFAMATKAS